ncbi:hypothetical protein ILUMI_12498 [Ignelater luminosus]|uniref:DDE-1 domain-containing protein n=1 Tax=Ignelater luminosus TaxID=2038154 RepID=A0A8K0CY16_IGNLU|nr:hypothetical protein ILUMI_12498 [Ignelater luminosus]
MDETGVQTVPNKLPKHTAPIGKKEVNKSVSAGTYNTYPIVLTLDNHPSHMTYEAVSYTKANNIHMVSLPPPPQ